MMPLSGIENRSGAKAPPYLIMILSAAFAFSQGCSCGDGDKGPCEDNRGPECCLEDQDCGESVFCCTINNQCMEPPSALESPPAPDILSGLYNDECEPGFFCGSLPDFVMGELPEDGCWFDWGCCEEADELPMGRIGTHTGMDVGGDSSVWISGYSSGASSEMRYGDLVAGPWDDSAQDVDWEILDGVPDDAWVTNSPDGWRDGKSEEGDDVGLYTSLLMDGSNPMITYYDRTNGALKFMAHDGSGWGSPAVIDAGMEGNETPQGGGDAGLYGEMFELPSGDAAVMYRSTTWQAQDHPGAEGYQVVHLASHLKLAVRSGGSWSVEVAATLEDTPCWGGACPEGYACRTEDLLCWPPADNDSYENCAACSLTQACLSNIDSLGTATGEFDCQDLTTLSDVPEGIGIWPSTALSPSGDIEAVFYDRTGGDLVWVRQQGGLWQEPVILDGDEDDPDPERHGDRGWYPSMAIGEDGTRHIVYVDGLSEIFVYMQVDPAGEAALKEVIDEGLDEISGEKDLVGDNSGVRVDASGRVRAVYQNSSDGVLLMAIRSSEGAWSLQEITDRSAGTMGYYTVHKLVADTSYIAFFYMNFESPPTSIGVDVMTCTVEGSGNVSCN
ncbi:MAG: hypothetical protein ABIJ56_06415 [Pseudomonadota bacterium]